jgi:hypothetical protein
MRQDQFFRGFLLALRASGIDYLKTRGNEHHKRFAVVVSHLVKVKNPELSSFAHTFRPNMLGLYRELDSALLRAQDSILGANNPSYPGLTYKIDGEAAEEILHKMFASEEATFKKLAAIYKKGSVPRPEALAA